MGRGASLAMSSAADGEVRKKSRKSGNFEGCNEKRSAARAALREEKRKAGLPVREPKPKVTNTFCDAAVQTDAGNPGGGDCEKAVSSVDKCVGESVWGDPFLKVGIWDM